MQNKDSLTIKEKIRNYIIVVLFYQVIISVLESNIDSLLARILGVIGIIAALALTVLTLLAPIKIVKQTDKDEIEDSEDKHDD